MKKIQGIILIMLITAASLFIYFNTKHGSPDIASEIVTKKIVRGRDSIDIKKGKEYITVKTENYNSALKMRRRKNKDYLFTDSTDTYSLVVKIPPEIDTNFINLDYLLDIKSKEVMRTDTIYRIRTDTMLINSVRAINKPNSFYDTFWFGSAVTSLVILLILLIK